MENKPQMNPLFYNRQIAIGKRILKDDNVMSLLTGTNLFENLEKLNPTSDDFRLVVEVRDIETSRGRGVFATQPILKSIPITVYPVHAVLCKRGGKRYMTTKMAGFEWNQAYSFSFQKGEITSICADKETIKPYCVGHMINDCIPNSLAEKMLEIRVKPDGVSNAVKGELVFKYLMYAHTFRNACISTEIDDNMILVFSLRDIKKGEEILICYSPSYWLGISNIAECINSYIDSLEGVKRVYVQEKMEVFKKLFSEYVV
jgi:hypothetical protein